MRLERKVDNSTGKVDSGWSLAHSLASRRSRGSASSTTDVGVVMLCMNDDGR